MAHIRVTLPSLTEIIGGRREGIMGGKCKTLKADFRRVEDKHARARGHTNVMLCFFLSTKASVHASSYLCRKEGGTGRT
jgi:hypothetical protein